MQHDAFSARAVERTRIGGMSERREPSNQTVLGMTVGAEYGRSKL